MKREEYLFAENVAVELRKLAEEPLIAEDGEDLGPLLNEGECKLLRQAAQLIITQRNLLMDKA